MSALLDTPDAVTPTPRDAGLAGESGAKLARHVSPDRDSVRVSVADGADSETVVVPMAAFRLFTQVLGRMARGEAVAVVPASADPRAAQRRALEELVAEGQALGLG